MDTKKVILLFQASLNLRVRWSFVVIPLEETALS
jgi:hypothetical protein